MQAFNRLIKTEFRNTRNIFIASAAAIVVAQIFLFFYAQGKTEQQAMISCSLINGLLISAAALIPFVHSFTIWTEEWKNNTNYLLFSIPVSKTKIFLSKFLSIFMEYIILLGIALIGFLIDSVFILHVNFNFNITSSLGSLTQFIICLLAISISFIFSCFFSILVGKLSPKFSGFISFIVFIAMNLLCNSIIAKIMNLFSSKYVSMNNFHFASNDTIGVIIFIIAEGIFAALYFLGSIYILEKKVEL